MSRILHKTIYTLNATRMLATLKGGAEFTQKGPTPPASVTFRTRCPFVFLISEYVMIICLNRKLLALYNVDLCWVGNEF
jgi:hypothetical protein